MRLNISIGNLQAVTDSFNPHPHGQEMGEGTTKHNLFNIMVIKNHTSAPGKSANAVCAEFGASAAYWRLACAEFRFIDMSNGEGKVALRTQTLRMYHLFSILVHIRCEKYHTPARSLEGHLKQFARTVVTSRQQVCMFQGLEF